MSSDPIFIFNEAEHEYFLVHEDGRIELLPSVTQIIDYCGFISDFAKQEFAALRGQFIHKAAHYRFENRLDWSSLDERIVPYLQSLDLWIKFAGYIAEACEVALHHPLLKYAGTFDTKGHTPEGYQWLIDVKSGVGEFWHPWQTGGYSLMEGGYRRRGCLYLQKDGSMAKFREHTDPLDATRFISLLNYYRMKEQYGH